MWGVNNRIENMIFFWLSPDQTIITNIYIFGEKKIYKRVPGVPQVQAAANPWHKETEKKDET